MIKQCRNSRVAWFCLTLCLGLSGHLQAGQQLQSIKQARQINFGFDSSRPFVTVGSNHTLTGFDIELAHALAKQLGVKAVLQPSKQDNLVASLTQGLSFQGRQRIDLIIGNWTVSDDYQGNFDFSAPYLVSAIQVLTQRSSTLPTQLPFDLAGKTVGALQNKNWIEPSTPQAIIKRYESWAAMYHALNHGLIDGVLESRFDAAQLVNAQTLPRDVLSSYVEDVMAREPQPALSVSGELLSRRDVGVALRKGEPELKAALNQAIAALRADGSLKEISEKYFGADITQ